MTPPRPATIVHLIGPAIADVAGFVTNICRDEPSPIIWDEFPELRVKCWDTSVVQALVKKYGAAVYSILGLSLERTTCAAMAASGLTLATAESCTGGLLGERITSVPGVSAFYNGGVVTYSNEAKSRLLGVPRELIQRVGAVSEEVVLAMADGVRQLLHADIGVAISGIAGPRGGTPEKPVGTVWIAIVAPGIEHAEKQYFQGERDRVRRAAAFRAIDMIRRVAIGAPLT